MKVEYLADHPSLLPTVAAWQHQQFGYLAPNTTLDDRIERLRRSLQKDALPMALVALSESGTLLGSAGILPTTITHQHLTPWLSSVFVPSEYRGKGIASALSLRAASEAARLGFDRLYLFTPRSETLYARIGWTEFERIDYNGVPLTLMQRPSRAAARIALDLRRCLTDCGAPSRAMRHRDPPSVPPGSDEFVVREERRAQTGTS